MFNPVFALVSMKNAPIDCAYSAASLQEICRLSSRSHLFPAIESIRMLTKDQRKTRDLPVIKMTGLQSSSSLACWGNV